MESKKTSYKVKELVREKYARIAKGEKKGCCGATDGCADKDHVGIASPLISQGYEILPGYVPEANLGLGCGFPTQYANIKRGDIVVDLGSGAGNDCFIARSFTGASGKVIGLDFTKEMVEKATVNAKKMGFDNVLFKLGDIENIPIDPGRVNVVISNCVFNLISNKKKGFEEVFRILKPGGYFIISDIVLRGRLPKGLIKDMEMYAGCIAGAIQKKDYLKLIRYLGFNKIAIQAEEKIKIPEHIMAAQLAELEREQYSHAGIISITVRGRKPFL